MSALRPGNGYTLIELLVAISIVALLSVTSIVYYKSLLQDQPLKKAVNSVQSFLRTAQSNATSGFNCGSVTGASQWSVRFTGSDKNKLYLNCGSADSVKVLTLENVIVGSISATGSTCSGEIGYPIDIIYKALAGTVSFASEHTGDIDCIAPATSVTLTLMSPDSSASCPDSCKTITVTNGGAINVR